MPASTKPQSEQKTEPKTRAYDKDFEQALLRYGYLDDWNSGRLPKTLQLG